MTDQIWRIVDTDGTPLDYLTSQEDAEEVLALFPVGSRLELDHDEPEPDNSIPPLFDGIEIEDSRGRRYACFVDWHVWYAQARDTGFLVNLKTRDARKAADWLTRCRFRRAS